MQVCSNIDPFCPAAVGGKYMDAASTKSLAVPQHRRFSVITNANGAASFLVTPSYLLDVFFGTVAAGIATFTIAGTSSPITAQSVRLVSCGLKIRSVVAPLSASGMVRIRGFAAKNGSSLTTASISTYNCDFYEDIPLNSCKEVAVVLRRNDPTAKNFVSPATINSTNNLTDMVMPGWGPVLVSVDGGPVSLASLDVELFYNWEIILADDDSLAQVQTSSPVFNQTVSTATDILSSAGKNVFLAGASAVASYVERGAIKLLGARFPMLAPLALTVD